MCPRAVAVPVSKDSTIVPPCVVSGIARRKGTIIGGFLLQTVVFAVSYQLQKAGSYFRPAEELCESSTAEEECTRPDLFAFQISAGVMLYYMGILGFLSWHITKRAHTAIPSTPEGRLFGYIEESDKLNAAIFCFQFWDLIVSMLIPEHNSAIFLTHHFLAATTAFFSLQYQYVHHYALFFGGCSEFSSVFLVFVDLAKFFPPDEGTPYDTYIFACQALFTITFFCYRVIGWWKVSLRLWSDALYVWRNGIAEQYRPGKSFVLYIFLIMDVLLGALQVFWFGQISLKVVEVLSG